MAEVTVINASEIRFELSGADLPKVLAAPKRVTRPRPRQPHVAAVRPNAGQLQQAEAQRKAAQTVFSVHTVRVSLPDLLELAIFGGVCGADLFRPNFGGLNLKIGFGRSKCNFGQQRLLAPYALRARGFEGYATIT
jgi:hypothetical protein